MNNSKEIAIQRAEKRIIAIKRFYSHLRLFLICSLLWLLFRFFLFDLLDPKLMTQPFVKWLNWNFYLLPALWAVVLLVHGLWVFKKPSIPFIKRWERKKIQSLLNNDIRKKEL